MFDLGVGTVSSYILSMAIYFVNVMNFQKKKEKEQKNERKDREKKEGRERKDRDRDKDRSKDKSREKKDKKEKRRDKDRKKDKDKDEKAAPFGRKDEDQEASLKVEGAAGRGQRKLEGVGGANGTERAGSAGAATHERAVACEVGIRPLGKGGGVAIAEQRRAGPASVLPEAQDHPFGGEQRRLDGSGQPAGKKSSTAAIAAIAAAATADAPEQRRASSLAGVAQEGAVDGGTVQSIASDRKTDGKKKAREKEASERKGDRDREKKHKGKDRARDKEEKKREKTKGEGEPRRREADKLRDAGNLGSSPAKPPAAAAAAATTAAAERKSPAANGPLSKRDRNGFFLHGKSTPGSLIFRGRAQDLSILLLMLLGLAINYRGRGAGQQAAPGRSFLPAPLGQRNQAGFRPHQLQQTHGQRGTAAQDQRHSGRGSSCAH